MFRQWNKDLLDVLDPLEVKNVILGIFLPSIRGDDVLVWGLNSDGEYSVRSGSLLIQGAS